MSEAVVTCPLCGAENSNRRLCVGCGKSLKVSTAAKRDRRMILIPLSIGCGIIGLAFSGVIAAVLIPNFIDAVQKAKQKRTVADLRIFGSAWQTWAADQGISVVDLAEDTQTYDFDSLQALAWTEFESRLVPDYLTEMSATDGWSHPFEVRADLEDGRLALRSAGRDGVFDSDQLPIEGFTTTDYDQDIVWAEGLFLRWPQR